MKQGFVAFRKPRANAFTLVWAIPIGSSRYCSGVRCETNQQCVIAVALTDELPYIPFTSIRSLCCPSIAQVRVVRPDHDLAATHLRIQVGGKRIKRVRHMLVAQIPGGYTPLEHRAIVLLSVLYKTCILLGIEELVGRYPAVTLGVLRCAALKFH